MIFFVFGDLLALFIAFTQLAIDGPHLLTQEKIPLVPGNFILDRRLDLGLHGGELHLANQQIVDLIQPLDRIIGFQKRLRFGDFEAQIGRHQICQAAGCINTF